MAVLELRQKTFTCPGAYSFNEDELFDIILTDFVIDRNSLLEAFEIEPQLPWFGYNGFWGQHTESVRKLTAELLGWQPPYNQFGTNRAVLYGCLCGCDYCGIISLTIEVSASEVRWSNFAREEHSHDGVSLSKLTPIEPLGPSITFEREQYEQAILEYVKTHWNL